MMIPISAMEPPLFLIKRGKRKKVLKLDTVNRLARDIMRNVGLYNIRKCSFPVLGGLCAEASSIDMQKESNKLAIIFKGFNLKPHLLKGEYQNSHEKVNPSVRVNTDWLPISSIIRRPTFILRSHRKWP